MVALQIRDVPDDVRQTLAERARARGQSLQAFLLSLVEDEARRSTNLALLDRFGGREDGSRLSPAEATDVLDRARADRNSRFETRAAPGEDLA
ncbi:FitA-like ribbon-helix-helix domain-containing protein [Arthrobacter monumenti]